MHNERALWSRVLMYDGYHRLMAVLVGLLLLQFVGWIVKENEIWLLQTVQLVKWTLLIVCLTYLIPRMRWLLRAELQLVLILLLHAKVLSYHFIGVNIHSWDSLYDFIASNLTQLLPYLWFSIGTWIVYLTTMWMVKTKSRIFALMVLSILFFAIRDSFSELILWQQAAVVMFCGLSLLVAVHFAQLKERAPKIWEHLADYPATLGIPIVLLIVIILMVGAFAPTLNPMLTDPYTAWKLHKGETVTLSSKGNSIPASVGDTSSGYSRNDLNLGSGFQFDYTPVMTVDASRKGYWRGETRSLYNGSGWELGDAEKHVGVTRVNSGTALQQNLLKGQTPELKQSVEVKQTVKMLNNEDYPVLFGAYEMQKIETINGDTVGLDTLLWSPRQAELRLNPVQSKIKYPKEYTLISQVPVLDEDGLRQSTMDFVNKAEWKDYLQLPDKLPTRVRQLAFNLTKDAGNPYDKVKKIEEYLSRNYKYTNTPDLAKGHSKDFVDRFLFEIQEGYCDYYSTAMVIMVRSIGMPARWVKGYAPGTSAIDEQMGIWERNSFIQRDPNVGGTFTVRNSDAHSWVEIYFNGYGWMPFEPTAGFSFPSVYPEGQAAALPDEPTNPVKVPDINEETSSTTQVWFTWLAIAFLLLGLSALLIYPFGFIRRFKKQFNKRRAVNFNQKMILEFEKLLRFSKRKGYTRQDHETIRETVHRWIQQSKWLKNDLEMMLSLFEKAKYSKATLSEEDFMHAAAAVEKLRSQMK